MPRIAKKQRQMEYKDIAGDAMQATGEGIVTGYLSTFNNIDQGNDRVIPGAFAVTIKDAKARRAAQGLDFLVPALWNHSWESLPVGGVTDMREDSHGLLVKIQMNLDTQLGRECYASLRNGQLSAMSMGYRAIISDYQQIEGKTVRNLRECALVESTFCVFPMNTNALVTSVKHQGGSSMFARRKDFDSRYAAQTLDDWAYADWYDLSTALKQSIMDLFAPGGDPVADLESQVIPGLLQALRQYVAEGVSLGYTSDSSNGMDMDMMSLASGFSEKSGYLNANAHTVIKEASTAIMKHAKAIQKVSQDLEASRSRGLQGVPNATASNRSYFEQKEAEANMDAQLKLINTRLEVDAALRAGKEALKETMPNATDGVDRALRQLLSKLA